MAERIVPSAPLPHRRLLARLWHGITNRRPYVVNLPRASRLPVIVGLLDEVEETFHRRNVRYEPEHHRLVIYGRKSDEAQKLVSYFRERANPKRLRLVPAHSGL